MCDTFAQGFLDLPVLSASLEVLLECLETEVFEAPETKNRSARSDLRITRLVGYKLIPGKVGIADGTGREV